LTARVATRLATAADLDAISVLFDLYRQFYRLAPDAARARTYLGERFARNESVLIVATARDETVGFCQMYPTFCSLRTAPAFVLYDLFVAPAARGAGVGKALMLAAERHARDCGAARIELATARSNAAAQALYESLGWKRDDEFFVYGRTLSGDSGEA
jgi:ribosomal protein S18 acetylase RimI-like enzyme